MALDKKMGHRRGFDFTSPKMRKDRKLTVVGLETGKGARTLNTTFTALNVVPNNSTAALFIKSRVQGKMRAATP